MGGIVDSGVVSDTKTSPRRAAIEKAQAELRQEYDVREERRRELEFLEKGGNPLDFKFGHGASISLQSTSLTEQLVEQYAISEAKGSFALAASPHCDSVESSGRPCGSVGREPNTADNLLLFDGELNNGLNRQKNSKRSGKRGISAALEHSSPADGCHRLKESDDSVFFHLGVKSQAYARRNRSKSVRDSSRAGSTDQVHSGNRPSVVPSSHSNSKDAKGLLWETQVDDHVVTSVSNSKPASPNGIVVPKTSPSGEQLDMEVDGIQPHVSSTDKIKDGAPESLAEANSSENLRRHDDDNRDAHFVANEILNGTTSLSSDSILKRGAVLDVGLVSPENNENIQGTGRISGSMVPYKGAVDFQDANRKTYSDDTATEALRINDTIEIREFDGSANQDQHLMLRKADSSPDGNCCPLVEIAHNELNHNQVGENHSITTVDGRISGSGQPGSALPKPCSPGAETRDMVVLSVGKNDIKNDEILSSIDDANLNGEVIAKSQKNQDNLPSDVSNANKKDYTTTGIMISSCSEPSHADKRKKVSCVITEPENGAPTYSTLSKKAHEDSILKEARIIEANLKRAGELSVSTIFSEKQKRCHWDYVLEEMMWLANDFMQERLWKTTAASQVCKWIASSGLLKFQEANKHRRQQYVARTLAKAIMHFWHSAERIRSSSMISTGIKEQCTSDMSSSLQANGVEAKKCKDIECIKEESSDTSVPLRGYAVRFLEYDSSLSDYPVLPEAPNTPDRIHDSGILEMSWEDHLSEKNLVYAVPSGAMQAYRESMELLWLPDKKHINAMHQEDCEVSVCDSVADVTHGSIYEEDEAETGAYVMPGTFESGLSSKFNHKKRNALQQKSPAGQLYEVGTNLSYETCLESKTGNQPLILNGKRPSSSFNVGSIPTKRVRTAARQRVVSPFSGVPGCAQATSKTDVSSGDTNSYQDDQSSLHGGPQCRKNLEVESTMDFDRQLPYESSEVSTKSKRKKKPKHLGYKNSLNLMDSGVLVVSGKGYPHDQRLQTDPMVQHEPIVRKRLDSPHLESNGNSGLYVHHAAKKPKLLKQLPETSPEAITPITGSMPSPVASQMSNMPNPHKLIRIITSRDRGRKKAMKMVAGQSGSGSPWSAFEDQALVVLVHDMGPNWELVSDAFNSTLLFKYIFRKPKECKDRHKFLMDKSAGDGADSAEDSGSSQPYPSTLPGIPKGSARQLFQRLQGPMEEDALKMHFEKIILLGQQLHSCRNQNDGRELKQIVQAHGSHVVTLSQIIPNNLNGSILTPLDLCDAITSSPDVAALAYQGSNTSALAIPSHQSSMAPVLPSSSANGILQGSPGMVLGSGLTSPSTPLGSASRDGPRYGASRPTSFPADDQQRMQHYNPMLSSRNVQQSGLSVPGALPVGVDRGGVRMLPGGNGMGMMCGMNRVMPMPRPNFQGISSPGMLNMVSTGSMLSCNSVGIANPVSVHPAAVSGAGNLMLRPRDALHMLRPGQPTEDHRQMPMQELQMQGSQGNCQGVSPFNGMSGPFSNATVSPVQTFPAHQHQPSSQMPQQPHHLGNHPHIQGSNHSSPQQPAYAIRFSKERQLQQRILPQPQPSFSGSSAISPMQGTHIQQQTQSSSPVTPSAQAQHKHQPMPRNQQAGCGVPNQMKQRQRPQVQQQPRNPQQQRQQPQQQAKLVKGLGRGTMLMHQNLPVDASHANGLPSASKNQVSEKHAIQQGQVLYSGNSGLTPSLLQPSGQQKIYARPVPQSSKPMSPMPSQSDSCNQGQIQAPGSHTLLATQQPFSQPSISLAAQQPQQHQTNHSPQSIQKVALPQNRQMSSDSKVQSSTDPVQVNQITPTTSIAQCTDLSSAPVASSSTQWKSEPSCDPSTPILSTHMASSPQENLATDEAVVVPTSQASLSQRHFSGALLINGHGIGGQWQQQQQPQSQQLEQPQHQHRQAAQGNSFVHPSDSGQDNKG